MNYNLAKKLKDAGFPYPCTSHDFQENGKVESLCTPTISELIEACGEDFESLIKQAGGWVAISNKENYIMKQAFRAVETPTEALVNLWLELNKK